MALATFPYRKLLLEIGKDLRDDELEQLKLLCKDFIPPAKAEGMRTGQLLFTALEEVGYITSSDVRMLKEILLPVRADLVTNVEIYEKQYSGVALAATESGQEVSNGPALGLKGQGVTDDILNEIGKSLARDWRSLARCLKVENDDILKIVADHRDSLEEQGIQMLFAWFKKFGSAKGNDSIGDLLMRSKAANVLDEALRKARLSSIADKNFGRVYFHQRENRPQNN